ncbi:MAG: 2-hydroxyacid dehydrogenase [Synergistaceae bacterium]|jgi:phosphoglycerate dehydrogenase-like enzyme|nr:2-hydroxyacid dehydrogenase [Synergistaceae bacterium]
MKVLFYSKELGRLVNTQAQGSGARPAASRSSLNPPVFLYEMKGHQVDTADETTIEKKIVDAEVLVTRPGAPVGRDLLRTAPGLKMLQQWGAGLEGIDFAACRDLGIIVCNTPSRGTGNAEGVTEIALLHMLLLGRKYSFAHENMYAGKMFSPRGISLWRKTACIVGLGNLGRTIAERLSAMGMTLRGVNRSPLTAERLEQMKIREFFPLSRLREAVSGCHFVVAALALSDETHELFDEEIFHAMDEGTFFINIARGALVKEDALLRALNEKRLAGAGLDVLRDEPPHPDNPLLHHPSVTLTPHIGGNTDESAKGIFEFIRDNVDRLSQGEEPLSRQDAKTGR